MQETQVVFEVEGYDILVTSDIVSYFENIELGILRDLLLQHLPKEQEIVNFLINLLEFWSWPAHQGSTAARGIPQGNEVSSFLGNIYLLPLDQALVALCRGRDLKYYRYVDDVKVFAKEDGPAWESLFQMNEILRTLRLNIQGAKTRILRGEELRRELFDDRLDRVNTVIKKSQEKKKGSTADAAKSSAKLRKELRSIRPRTQVRTGKDLRLFRRLLTGFSLLDDSSLVPHALDQMALNPEARLWTSTTNYLKRRVRNRQTIARALSDALTVDVPQFAFQKALLLMGLRYVRNPPLQAVREARRLYKRRKSEHWYVRQQAVLLAGMQKIRKRQYDAWLGLYERERHPEVKRAWALAMTQGPREELEKLSESLLLNTDASLHRLGRFFHQLLTKEDRGKTQLKSLENITSEESLVDRLPEFELVLRADSPEVRSRALRELKRRRRQVSRPILQTRFNGMINTLEAVDNK